MLHSTPKAPLCRALRPGRAARHSCPQQSVPALTDGQSAGIEPRQNVHTRPGVTKAPRRSLALCLTLASCTGSIAGPAAPEATGAAGTAEIPGQTGVGSDGAPLASACLAPADVGPAPLKRLTQNEYRRAVRD